MSEFAKVAVILFLASYVTSNVKKMYRMRTLIKVMMVVLPVVGLVGASNLSTAIIILSIAVVLVFVASPKYGQFIFLGAAGAGFMGIFLALESYRLERLAVWKNPAVILTELKCGVKRVLFLTVTQKIIIFMPTYSISFVMIKAFILLKSAYVSITIITLLQIEW